MIRHFVTIKIVPKFVPALITFVSFEYYPIRRRFVFVTLDRGELKNDNDSLELSPNIANCPLKYLKVGELLVLIEK